MMKADKRLNSFKFRNINKITLSRMKEFASAIETNSMLLILLSVLFGSFFIYAILVSKMTPESGIYILDLIKYDHYYCYILPLLIIPTYFMIYVYWLCYNLFENN